MSEGGDQPGRTWCSADITSYVCPILRHGAPLLARRKLAFQLATTNRISDAIVEIRGIGQGPWLALVVEVHRTVIRRIRSRIPPDHSRDDLVSVSG
jgi:transglutaminase-like putative cysteine protease